MRKIEVHKSNRRIVTIYSLIIRIASLIARTKEGVKIKKVGKIPKPPYLVISTHASFMDFFVSIKANEPYKPYWISTIEEYIDKDYIFRALGIIPKRKFTNDPISANLVIDALKTRKKSLIVYPEARYSFVGKPERIDRGLAKLAKMCDVPIVFMQCNGHYLRDPQWGDHKIRKVKGMRAYMRCIVNKRQIRDLSVEEINMLIDQNFKYDEEQYQLDNNIKITYPKRAEGIERILYKCPHCGKEFEMSSNGTTFKCDSCGATYNLNEDGTISCITGEAKFNKVSDWYYWEKECVKKEVENGSYFFEDDIRLERLEGVGVGFIPQEGRYHLTHDINNGIIVTGDNGFKYERSSLQSYAIHIEYDYKKRGGCIDLATNSETYFGYPLNKAKSLTKIHFAVELIYDHFKQNLKEDK